MISLGVVLGSSAVFAHGNGPGEPDPHCSFKLTEAIFYLNAHLDDEATQNRHFCHFYPRLGGVVFSVTDKSGAAVLVQLQLLSFTDALAEIVLNETVDNRSGTSQGQLSQVFTARGLYMLRVNAQQNEGNGAEKTFIWLAVGLPIAEVFLGIAGFFLIMLIYYAMMPTNNKPDD